MESSAEEVLDMIGTAPSEKKAMPEFQPEIPPTDSIPDDTDIPGKEGGFKLANDTFDPADENFDGGLTS